MDYNSDNMALVSTAIQNYVLVTVTPDETDEAAVAAEAARQEKWTEALTHGAPVRRIVAAYDVLKQDREDGILDADGLALLARLAHRIVDGSFHGKKNEASLLFSSVVAELSA